MLIVTASSIEYEKEEKIELDGPVDFCTMEVTTSSLVVRSWNSVCDDVKKGVRKP